MMRKPILLLGFLVCIFKVGAQVTIQFMPEIQGRSLDGLLQVKVINTGSQLSGSTKMTIRVTAAGSGEVVKMVIRGITIQPGINTLHPSSLNKATVNFSNNALGRIVSQSNQFPEAYYEYCYLLEDEKTNSLVGEECFDLKLEPLSPLSLIEPYDKIRICEKNPTLVWQPIFPAIPGLQYQLTLVEIKPKQSATEALYYNVPVINARNLLTSFLPYPPSARDLDTTREYVWQVTAYKGDVIISRSEVWTFKPGCDETPAPIPVDGYRNIEDLVMGNYYIAEGRILFALENPYKETKLSYEIESLTEPDAKIKRLPEVRLTRGRNNVIIPLEDVKNLSDGHNYILKMTMPNGTARSLRFTYKN